MNDVESQAIVSIACRHGDFKFYPNDDPIGKSLIKYGEWAEAEIALLTRIISKGDVVIDIGANIGTHTVAFARHVGPTGSVYSFEPQRALSTLLQSNTKCNDLNNVHVFETAIGRSSENMYVPVIDYSSHINSGAISLVDKSNKSDEDEYDVVEVKALDDYDIGFVNLVKIDVEGMEISVLEGAKRLIHSCYPTIYTECNSIASGWRVVEHLYQCGYSAFLHVAPAYNPRNFRRCDDNFFGVAHETNILCVHQDKLSDLQSVVVGNKELYPITDLDEFASRFIQVPRYGDRTLNDRSPSYLQKTISELYHNIAEKEQQLSALTNVLSEEQRNGLALSGEIMALQSTLSWRITSPLRRLKRFSRTAMSGFSKELRYRRVRMTIQRSLMFDREFYLHTYPDMNKSGIDPVRHYILHGADEGRNPSGAFNTSFYLRRYPDVANSKLNPLEHYIRYGVREHRRPVPTAYEDFINFDALPKAEVNDPPTPEMWASVVRKQQLRKGGSEDPKIDIIVPVYKGFDETLNCIYSILDSAVRVPYELVVINDNSPDPLLATELQRLSNLGLFSLIVNETNLGFVATVNKGMVLHQSRDVVLLNSDTEVYWDWLDRLHETAYKQNGIGTVTPLSNSATICSYPVFCRDNNMKLEVSYQEIDKLAAVCNQDAALEIPTAVGFCMYIKRQCLKDVGLFDVQRFGRGYGEENDFSLRAKQRGWLNMLAGNVFVHHLGSTSFGDERVNRVQSALQVLREKFPKYDELIGEFIQSDPAATLRYKLDVARLTRLATQYSMLLVTHNWGGGTERHVQEMTRLLSEQGVSVYFMRVDTNNPSLARIYHASDPFTPNLPLIALDSGTHRFEQLLNDLNIRHIHVHHLAGFDFGYSDQIARVAKSAGIDYDVTIHDYMSICPRINLINETGVYCGEPDLTGCQKCIDVNGSPFGNVSVKTWRERYSKLLANARCVFVPNIDVSRRLANYFPSVDFVVRPHPMVEPIDVPRTVVRPHTGDNNLRIAIVGAIGPQKGSRLVYECAQDALARKLPIEYVIIGYTDMDGEFGRLKNVTVTGKYTEDEVDKLLAHYNCNLAWFPAVGPETYSYTFDIVKRAQIFPVAFDIGAIAERMKVLRWGDCLPVSLMENPKSCNDYILRVALNADSMGFDAAAENHLYSDMIRDYYGLSSTLEAR